jgi:hypothetical protein
MAFWAAAEPSVRKDKPKITAAMDLNIFKKYLEPVRNLLRLLAIRNNRKTAVIAISAFHPIAVRSR